MRMRMSSPVVAVEGSGSGLRASSDSSGSSVGSGGVSRGWGSSARSVGSGSRSVGSGSSTVGSGSGSGVSIWSSSGAGARAPSTRAGGETISTS